jgi:hypothetical protein
VHETGGSYDEAVASHAEGGSSPWLLAAEKELCTSPISPAETLRLGRLHALQLEMPGDGLFSVPSTLCGIANGAVRLLDPRIRMTADFELAGLDTSPRDRPIRVSTPCELAAATAASAHSVVEAFGVQSRLFAQRCLGSELPTLLAVAIRAFAAERAKCDQPGVADALVETLLARASSTDDVLIARVAV